jgi:hypothetical protein
MWYVPIFTVSLHTGICFLYTVNTLIITEKQITDWSKYVIPRCCVLFCTLIVAKLVRVFPTFYGTINVISLRSPNILKLIHVLSQFNPVHTPTSSFFRTYFIATLHVHRGLPNGLFRSGLRNKILYVFVFFPFTLHVSLKTIYLSVTIK